MGNTYTRVKRDTQRKKIIKCGKVIYHGQGIAALHNVVSEDETAVATFLEPANDSLWWHWCFAPVCQLNFVLAGKKATGDKAVVLYFRLPKHAA